MITKFDSSYVGSVDLENPGYGGTPINDRHYPNQELASVLHKAVAYAKQMDARGYDTFWMAEHHFQPEGTECIPNLLMMALHLAGVTKNLRIGCGFNVVPMWHPLRLAEDYAMADVLTGGRVIFGVARGYHTREVESFGAPLTDQAANREMFEEGVDIVFKAFNEERFSHKGKLLHDPAGGALSRLHAEGHHPGAARRCACRSNAGSRSRAAPSAPSTSWPSTASRGVIGGGSAEGGAVDKHMIGFQAAYARRGIKLELGERLSLGFQFFIARKPRGGDPRGRQILRREHEDVRRTAPGARALRRADRGDARSQRWPAPPSCRASRTR